VAAAVAVARRPLSVLNFRLSRIIEGGLNPMAFHRDNLILHGVVVALFYVFVEKLFESTAFARCAAHASTALEEPARAEPRPNHLECSPYDDSRSSKAWSSPLAPDPL